MDIEALLYAIGAMGFFTSRAFVPAWATAVVLRYGDSLPYLKEIEFLQATGAEPMWFTSNWTILLLTVLASIEVAATKSPEAREMLADVHKYAKSAISAVATMGVFGAADIEFVESILSQQAGMLDTIVGGVVAVSVYIGSTLRQSLVELFLDADPDDSLGIQNLMSWGEDVWALFGVFLFFFYPLLIAVLIALILGGLFLMRRYRERKEDQSRIDCASCGARMYPSARICPSCKSANPNVRAIGFFGTALEKPAEDLTAHGFRLATKRRCMACAGRLKERRLPQTCPDCGTSVLASSADQAAYLDTVSARVPKVLGVSALFSLIPVVGIIPGIIYYRIQLLAPFRVYLPASHGLLLKWLLRLLFIFLISLQVVPGAGVISIPLMATISYFAYRSWFSAQLPEG